MLLILILTDWFSSLTDRINKYIVILTLIIILLASLISIPIFNGWKLNLGGFILPLFFYIFLLTRLLSDRVYLITSTILLGSSYFLFKELIRLDPVLLFWEELYELTLFLVVIVMIVLSKLEYKVALLLGGILLGEFLFHFNHKEHLSIITLGDASLRDILWVSLIQIIALHFLIKWIRNWKDRKLTTD